MTALLEVVIGVITLYLVLSLIVSAVNEALAGISKRRAAFLQKGIGNLLGSVLSERVYAHGLVQGLARRNATGPGKPSYISAAVFGRALLDVVGSQFPVAAADPEGPPPPPPLAPLVALPDDAQLAALRTRIAAVPSLAPTRQEALGGAPALGLAQALGVLAGESKTMAELEQKVESWYDEAMDRVSGWYKRRTAVILFALGAVLVVGLNADTINVAKTLWTHPDIRSAVVAQAEKTVQAGPTPTETVADAAGAVTGVAQLNVPLGWVSSSKPGDPRDAPSDTGGWFLKIAGLLMTSIALSFGAPFWFDLLKSFVAIRASGSSPAESSSSRT